MKSQKWNVGRCSKSGKQKKGNEKNGKGQTRKAGPVYSSPSKIGKWGCEIWKSENKKLKGGIGTWKKEG